MGDSGKDDRQGERKPRFRQDQYDLLMKCSTSCGRDEMPDWTEWIEYRDDHPGQAIELQGAALTEANLRGAPLCSQDYSSRSEDGSCQWGEVHLEGAFFYETHLEGANLIESHLEHATLLAAHLEGALFIRAHLEYADFLSLDLRGAQLSWAQLEGARLCWSSLEGADFEEVTVNGATLVADCWVDRNTSFDSVPLDAARIQPKIKQLLEFNVRRNNWKAWYERHPFAQWPLRFFWWVPDYGLRTWRIIGVFFALAFAFGLAYYIWPEFVHDSLVDGQNHVPDRYYPFLRAMYFSIVTMTTLGFGDIHAAVGSIPGHILLTVQVLLGYLLLGALITRFAVLFQAGGPAGEFAETWHRKEWLDDFKQRHGELPPWLRWEDEEAEGEAE